MLFKSCAIVGATGLVGKEIVSIMNNYSKFTFDKLFLYSSSQTKKLSLTYKGKKISVLPFNENDIPQVDILFSSVDESLSRKFVPLFVKKGAYVIDDSSAFRLDKDWALVVCGINDNFIKKTQKLYAQPNCIVVGIAYPISLINKEYKIKKVYVATYQSISGAGRNAFNDFITNLQKDLKGNEIVLRVFKNDPVLNAIPVIPDSNESNMFTNFTKEEEKISLETNRILNTNLDIIATCVRVSVKVGHSASVFIETDGTPSYSAVEGILNKCEFMEFNNGAVFTPKFAAGKDKVYICRLRVLGNTIGFWATWDNLRIGSALNMWNIFTRLLES